LEGREYYSEYLTTKINWDGHANSICIGNWKLRKADESERKEGVGCLLGGMDGGIPNCDGSAKKYKQEGRLIGWL